MLFVTHPPIPICMYMYMPVNQNESGVLMPSILIDTNDYECYIRIDYVRVYLWKSVSRYSHFQLESLHKL